MADSGTGRGPGWGGGGGVGVGRMGTVSKSRTMMSTRMSSSVLRVAMLIGYEKGQGPSRRARNLQSRASRFFNIRLQLPAHVPATLQGFLGMFYILLVRKVVIIR